MFCETCRRWYWENAAWSTVVPRSTPTESRWKIEYSPVLQLIISPNNFPRQWSSCCSFDIMDDSYSGYSHGVSEKYQYLPFGAELEAEIGPSRLCLMAYNTLYVLPSGSTWMYSNCWPQQGSQDIGPGFYGVPDGEIIRFVKVTFQTFLAGLKLVTGFPSR